MFMGTYNNSIDAKNRMIVPAKHRDQLGDGCVITIGIEKCLTIYSQESWNKQAEKMESIPESDLESRKYVRLFFSHAEECTFDKQGRIIIPEHLKDYAGITKELVTMGVKTKIEVWAKEVWDAPDNRGKIEPDKWADALLKYGF
ncbi:MAG: division/cell wall cluster transcriptional repressor MraZ [Firmicutes bacterium]|nr:division/cell wall cluster transcriptional repressor MraZ [Bacillota bacterium]